MVVITKVFEWNGIILDDVVARFDNWQDARSYWNQLENQDDYRIYEIFTK